MDREFLLKLVFATVKIANLLPEENIRQRIKDAAFHIAEDLLLFFANDLVLPERKRFIHERLTSQLSLLQEQFSRAKAQRWIDPANFLVLEREYSKIQRDFQAAPLLFQKEQSLEEGGNDLLLSKEEIQQPEYEKEREGPVVSERQTKILNVLRNRSSTQVWELQKVLPEVTKRTLRRDLDDLLRMNLIERQGEWNAVSYRLKRTEDHFYKSQKFNAVKTVEKLWKS